MRDIDRNSYAARPTHLRPHAQLILLALLETDAEMLTLIEEAKSAIRSLLCDRTTQPEGSLGRTSARRGLEQLGKVIPLPDTSLAAASPWPPAYGELSLRERDVLQLMTEGLRNQEIARRLGIREKTVRNHVSNIFSKLQVNDRSQAIVMALRGRPAQSHPLTPTA